MPPCVPLLHVLADRTGHAPCCHPTWTHFRSRPQGGKVLLAGFDQLWRPLEANHTALLHLLQSLAATTHTASTAVPASAAPLSAAAVAELPTADVVFGCKLDAMQAAFTCSLASRGVKSGCEDGLGREDGLGLRPPPLAGGDPSKESAIEGVASAYEDSELAFGLPAARGVAELARVMTMHFATYARLVLRPVAALALDAAARICTRVAAPSLPPGLNRLATPAVARFERACCNAANVRLLRPRRCAAVATSLARLETQRGKLARGREQLLWVYGDAHAHAHGGTATSIRRTIVLPSVRAALDVARGALEDAEGARRAHGAACDTVVATVVGTLPPPDRSWAQGVSQSAGVEATMARRALLEQVPSPPYPPGTTIPCLLCYLATNFASPSEDTTILTGWRVRLLRAGSGAGRQRKCARRRQCRAHRPTGGGGRGGTASGGDANRGERRRGGDP